MVKANPKAVILVGGEGRRLQPLTFYLPKPMVPVLNRPFMEHTIAYLEQSGVSGVVLAISYLPEVIQGYFGDGTGLGVKIEYAIEREPLGTAGAVKNAGSYLDGTFIVLNGDIFSQVDLADMLAFHRRKQARATIALTWVEDPSAFGVVETDADGRVKRFIEKPSPGSATTHWINAGVYILEPEVLAHVPAGQFFMFERGVFPRLLELGEPLYGYRLGGYWLDMGTVEKYLRLNRDILLGEARTPLITLSRDAVCCDGAAIHPSAQVAGPVVIGSGSRIAGGARITGPAVIGAGCEVSEGASIAGAVLWDGASIGAGAALDGCVIGNNVYIDSNSRVTRCVVTANHGRSEIA